MWLRIMGAARCCSGTCAVAIESGMKVWAKYNESSALRQRHVCSGDKFGGPCAVARFELGDHQAPNSAITYKKVIREKVSVRGNECIITLFVRLERVRKRMLSTSSDDIGMGGHAHASSIEAAGPRPGAAMQVMWLAHKKGCVCNM